MLHLAGQVDSLETGITKMQKALKDGSAKKKFMDMLVAQGKLGLAKKLTKIVKNVQ